MGYIPTEEYDWHIGGFSSDAVDCVYKKLDKATDETDSGKENEKSDYGN